MTKLVRTSGKVSDLEISITRDSRRLTSMHRPSWRRQRIMGIFDWATSSCGAKGVLSWRFVQLKVIEDAIYAICGVLGLHLQF